MRRVAVGGTSMSLFRVSAFRDRTEGNHHTIVLSRFTSAVIGKQEREAVYWRRGCCQRVDWQVTERRTNQIKDK